MLLRAFAYQHCCRAYLLTNFMTANPRYGPLIIIFHSISRCLALLFCKYFFSIKYGFCCHFGLRLNLAFICSLWRWLVRFCARVSQKRHCLPTKMGTCYDPTKTNKTMQTFECNIFLFSQIFWLALCQTEWITVNEAIFGKRSRAAAFVDPVTAPLTPNQTIQTRDGHDIVEPSFDNVCMCVCVFVG